EGGEVRGALADDARATHVWVMGGPERAAVSGGRFTLERLDGDTLDLRFAREGEEVARMEVIRTPGSGDLSLEGIWFDGEAGLAYPERVAADGLVSVNGLRMTGAEATPGEVDGRATLLAISGAGDALIVRPLDDALPDLRVVVTPGTLARSVDGDP